MHGLDNAWDRDETSQQAHAVSFCLVSPTRKCLGKVRLVNVRAVDRSCVRYALLDWVRSQAYELNLC